MQLEVKEQMNMLYKKKHFAQSVTRNEKFFIKDLKKKIGQRHDDL